LIALVYYKGVEISFSPALTNEPSGPLALGACSPPSTASVNCRLLRFVVAFVVAVEKKRRERRGEIADFHVRPDVAEDAAKLSCHERAQETPTLKISVFQLAFQSHFELKKDIQYTL